MELTKLVNGIRIPLSEEEVNEIQNEWDTNKQKHLDNKYKIERKKDYPKLEDQLDMIYHKGLDHWKAEIKKIKDRYPKSE